MSDSSTNDEPDDETEAESVDETLDQLSDTVEETATDDDQAESEDDTGATADTQADEESTDEGESEVPGAELVTRAVTAIESLMTDLGDDGSFDDAQEDVEDLLAVADEAQELLQTVDLGELTEAVDLADLPEAVEADDLPEAVAKGDPGAAIQYRKLAQVVELGELWSGQDMRELWRNKRELEEATDDVADDSTDDDGALAKMRETLDSLTDDSEEREFFDDSASSDEGEAEADTEKDDLDIPSEAIEQQIQSGLDDAIEEFRQGVLEVRDRLEDLKAENEERTEDVEQPSSRNPTAYSTLPSARSDMHGVAKFSTIPSETKYSTAPNRKRIYGSRFDDREDDDE